MNSKSIIKHTFSGKTETYILKLKDKPERAGISIFNKNGDMNLKELRIEKFPNETNKIRVQLIKEEKD